MSWKFFHLYKDITHHCHSNSEVWSQPVVRVTQICTQRIFINASLVYEMWQLSFSVCSLWLVHWNVKVLLKWLLHTKTQLVSHILWESIKGIALIQRESLYLLIIQRESLYLLIISNSQCLPFWVYKYQLSFLSFVSFTIITYLPTIAIHIASQLSNYYLPK